MIVKEDKILFQNFVFDVNGIYSSYLNEVKIDEGQNYNIYQDSIIIMISQPIYYQRCLFE